MGTEETIQHLKAKCEVYRLERRTLLRVISDLTDMLNDKFEKDNSKDVTDACDNTLPEKNCR